MTRTRIFFATDVHGSERCFRKFVNAGEFYKADVLILGGDLTGKMIIPIVEQSDGSFILHFLGKDYVLLRGSKELEEMEKKIRIAGYYPYYTSEDDIKEVDAHPKKLDQLFEQLMCETLEKWIRIAEERLRGTSIKCFISPGNDDRYCIDQILEKSDYIIYPEGKVIEVDKHHEMISCGYANITPWRCPRDIPEEELAKKIESIASQVRDMKNCIFNFHCPPYNTPIDVAPLLNESLRPVLAPGGGAEMIHVGSKSVRDAIMKHQPLLGLHGHIHESRGLVKLGRTLCINPGSEYGEGILRGVIVDLSEGRVEDYLLTSG